MKLVILDEPTSSLDAVACRAASWAMFAGSWRAAARCILISHLLGEILSTADRIVVHDATARWSPTRPASSFTSRQPGRRRWAASSRNSDAEASRSRTSGRARSSPVPAPCRGQTDGADSLAHRGEVVGLAGLGRPWPDRDAASTFFARQQRLVLARGSGARRSRFVAGDRQPRRHLPAVVDR